MDEKLAAELVEMAESQFAAQAPLAELMEEDPAFAAWVRRVQMPITGIWEDGEPPAALVELWSLLGEHDARLKEIIDRRGWPGRSLVGEDGADAAWSSRSTPIGITNGAGRGCPSLKRQQTTGKPTRATSLDWRIVSPWWTGERSCMARGPKLDLLVTCCSTLLLKAAPRTWTSDGSP